MKTITICLIALLLVSTVHAAPTIGKQPSSSFFGSWPYQAAYTDLSFDSKTNQYTLSFDIYDYYGEYRATSTTYVLPGEPLAAIDNRVDAELWLAFTNDIGGFDNALTYTFKSRFYRSYAYGGVCTQ